MKAKFLRALISTTLLVSTNAGFADNSSSQPSRAVSFISGAPQLKSESPQLQPETPIAAPENVPHPAPDAHAAESKPDPYPLVGNLESITFGKPNPSLALSDRLAKLEQAVFKKTFADLSLFERTKKLRETLVGPQEGAKAPAESAGGPPASGGTVETKKPQEDEDPVLSQPEYKLEASYDVLSHFAMQLLNDARADHALAPLVWDDLAYKVADKQAQELREHNVVSHFDAQNENPDLRYTKESGADACTENIICFSGDPDTKANKALIVKILRAMVKSQDDRESLLSSDATHFAFSLVKQKNYDRWIGIAEVVTKRGIMHPLPKEVTVGEKIEVNGIVNAPYKFQRVTIAWEGLNEKPRSVDETQEALPYFPPLDFVAFGRHSEHDWEKQANFLRMAGVVAAIAGGVIIPPVAFAAPLIALAPGGEPKAVSEIPVHGGMKVDGQLFSGKIPLSNNGKAGLYYVTVWASANDNLKPVAISRRVIVANPAPEREVRK